MAYNRTGDEAWFGLTPDGQVDPSSPMNKPGWGRGISPISGGYYDPGMSYAGGNPNFDEGAFSRGMPMPVDDRGWGTVPSGTPTAMPKGGLGAGMLGGMQGGMQALLGALMGRGATGGYWTPGMTIGGAGQMGSGMAPSLGVLPSMPAVGAPAVPMQPLPQQYAQPQQQSGMVQNADYAPINSVGPGVPQQFNGGMSPQMSALIQMLTRGEIDMATTTPGQYDWIGQVLGGAYNLATANQSRTDANQFAQVADPFASQRGQYQTQLHDWMANPANSPGANSNQAGINTALGRMNTLLDDPSSLEKQPGYQWGMNQALEAVNRGAGSSGLLNSGNRLTALQDRGQGYAQGWQQQIWNELLGNTNANINAGQLGLATQGQGFNQLGQLAGVNAGNPAAAAALLAQGRAGQNQAIGAGIGGLTNGAAGAIQLFQRLFGNGGGGGWNGATPGGANGSWDIDPGFNVDGGANGSWDIPVWDNTALPDDWSGWLAGG